MEWDDATKTMWLAEAESAVAFRAMLEVGVVPDTVESFKRMIELATGDAEQAEELAAKVRRAVFDEKVKAKYAGK